MKITRNTVRLILTGLSLIGIPLTSYLSVKGYEKAKDKETKKEKLKCYIPAIVSGTLTGGCILAGQHEANKEIAALAVTATYAVANRDKLEQSIKPLLTEGEVKEVTKEARENTIKEVIKHPSIEATGYGNLLVLDGYSGRLFRSSYDKVLDAEAKLTDKFRKGNRVCYNDFYRYLGIVQTKQGQQFGWIPDEQWYPRWYDENPLCIENSYGEYSDGEQMLIIDIFTLPMEFWMEDITV